MRKDFTRRQIPGALILLGVFAWSVYSGNWAGYLIGLGSFYAGAIIAIQVIKWHGQRQVRRILAESPHLAYLAAVQQEFGLGEAHGNIQANGKDD